MKMPDNVTEIRIDERTEQAVRREVQRCYPCEACGMLLTENESDVITGILPLDNDAEKSIGNTHFAIDPLKLYQAEQKAEAEGYAVTGFYHSHPDHKAVLSEEDAAFMIPGMISLILPVTADATGKGRAYRKETVSGTAAELTVITV